MLTHSRNLSDQAVRGSVNFDTMPLIPRGPRRKRLGENGDVAEANGTGEAAMEPMVMPPSRKLPVCISWCPIPRSVYSEDETTLQHIPYGVPLSSCLDASYSVCFGPTAVTLEMETTSIS